MLSFSVSAANEEAPGRPAMITPQETVSYRGLAQKVAEMQGRIRNHRTVAVVGHLQAETIFTIWAALETRVPLAMIHPALTPNERADALAKVGADLLIDGDGFFERCPSCPIEHKQGDVLLFTSGTTGTPKAAVLSRRALLAAAKAATDHFKWSTEDRWALALPVAHVGGFSILTRCLFNRAAVVLPGRFEPRAFSEALRTFKVTITSLVPTMLRRMLDHGFQGAPDLKTVLLGGAPPKGVWAEARRRGIPVVEAYGMTETCAFAVVDGRPLPGVQIDIREGRIQIKKPHLVLRLPR